VAVVGHTFEPRSLGDPARMVAEAISTAGYTHRVVVTVRAPADEVARLIPPHVGMTEPDGIDAQVELGVDDFDWLAGYLIGLGVDFEVGEPVEMRRHLRALGERLAADHAAAPPSSSPSPSPSP
jgi:predicted DNA-binding transcriptional regulator YafY